MALKYTIQLDRYDISIFDSKWSGSSKEISPNVIQSINFDIEGENNDITAPIIKTSLSMTFVDAPDLPEAGTMKCGDWEEFYTPDARRWEVGIVEDGDVVWVGYITPDSYTEELRYRGSVTLIARDGIGMLNDIMFDAEGNEAGLITPKEIITQGMALIGTDPTIVYGDDDDAWIETSRGTKAYDTFIPVSAFQDKSWYEVMEEVLIAYGACMRFINGNTWAVTSLRYLPKLRQLSWHGASKLEVPIFIAYATREMVPAVRSIHEVVEYNTGDGKALPMADAFAFTGEVSSYTYKTYDNGVRTIQAPAHPITSNNIWSGDMLFNPDLYGFDRVANEMSNNAVFIGMFEYKHSDSYLNKVKFSYPLSKTSGVLKMSLGNIVALKNNVVQSLPIHPQVVFIAHLISDDGTDYYYNGDSFTTTYAEYQWGPMAEGIMELPLALEGLSGESFTLELMFYYIGVAGVEAYEGFDGMYACINSIALERIGTQSFLSTNRVNTIYSESNNVKIDRKPTIGPAFNNAIVPSIIKNGIFDILSTGAYVPSPKWRFAAGGPSQQLAVYNHLCIIPYYAKPHNLLQGTILRESKMIDPCLTWIWNGQKHILLNGSFDLISGRISRAVLHEYNTYDELWGYTSSTIPQVSVSTDFSSSESGGSSSGSGGGGGGTTITVDSVMSDTSVNPVQNKVIKSYVDTSIADLNIPEGVSVDTAMSNTSTNSVQNKVIKAYVDNAVSGVEVSVDSAMSDSSTGAVQNKVIKAYVDEGLDKQFAGRSAGPKVKMFWSRDLEAYALTWYHPWQEREGAELVLMHYNRRACVKIDRKHKKSKAWRMAHGRKQTFETSNSHFSLSSLKDYIVQSWLYLKNSNDVILSDDYMLAMTYAGYQSGTWLEQYFRNNYNNSKLFGWAVRIPNPAFDEQVDTSRTLTKATTQINGVPRYLYTEVTPMRAYVHYSNDLYQMGIRLTE